MSTIPASSSSVAVARRREGRFAQLKRGLLGLLIILVALCGSGAIYQAVATARDRVTYPPLGRLVDVDGYKMHIYCTGTAAPGSPTVILESGQANALSIWGWVQPGASQSTQVCAYDRAGIGWSDARPEPRDGNEVARELHALLHNAGIAPPYVLAGHSLGGLYVRAYAAQYPGDVAGVVLVDAEHPDQWTRTPEGQAQYQNIRRMSGVGRLLARLGILRALNFFPASPDLPPRQSAEFKAWADSTRQIDVNVAEFEATPATDEQVRGAGDLGDMSLVVLTATDHGYPAGEPLWQALQRELAGLSSNSAQRVVPGATHASLQSNREHAAITIHAIAQVVAAARSGQRLIQK
jgi:pimeloyl-ACP methyl ester carboxylesterase